jgi:hypothetical protein
MKKIYSLLVILSISLNAAFAGGSCVIDSSNTEFLSPPADSIPCIERGVFYSQAIQLLVPDSIDLINYGAPFSFVLYVDSVILNGIDGLPVGISNTVNPAPGVFYPGQYACVLMSGTTTDTVGHYNLILNGNITAHGQPYPPIFDGDTTIDLATLQLMSLGQLDMYVDVIEQGAACRSLWAGLPCIIDTSNTAFFTPRPDSLPCVERNLTYSEIIQITIPVSIDLQDFGSPIPFILYVDSVVITGANGLPSGITYSANPANGVLYGGDHGCALVSGTTSDPAGNYPISFIGTFTAHGQPFPPFFDGDTTIDFATLQAQSGGLFDLFVDVIEPGAACRPAPSSVGDFNADLNALVTVYPNPNNGVFEFKLNAGRRVNGDINVIDVTGRKVFAQAIDVTGIYSTTINLQQFAKGIYTLQLRTADTIVSRSISVE